MGRVTRGPNISNLYRRCQRRIEEAWKRAKYMEHNLRYDKQNKSYQGLNCTNLVWCPLNVDSYRTYRHHMNMIYRRNMRPKLRSVAPSWNLMHVHYTSCDCYQSSEWTIAKVVLLGDRGLRKILSRRSRSRS